MGLIAKQTNSPAHSRKIEIFTYPAGDKHVIVEGTLIDDRLQSYYNLKGEKILPHILHYMIIRMLIEGPSFTIKEIEVQMPTVPNVICLETIRSMERIKGTSITTGFTAKIKKLIGAKEGCSHLHALVTAMAPTAIQGFWACKEEKKPLIKDISSSSLLEKYVIDSCWLWRSDGPIARKFLAKTK